MKFNGISMGETPTVFISKLKAKGFTPKYYDDTILTGNFVVKKIVLLLSQLIEIWYLVLQVIFPQSEKWEDLENLYIYFKSIKTGKGILDKIENTFKKNYLPIRKVAPPDSRHREPQSQPQD